MALTPERARVLGLALAIVPLLAAAVLALGPARGVRRDIGAQATPESRRAVP